MSEVATPEEFDLSTPEGFMASLSHDMGGDPVTLTEESAPAPAVSEEVAASEETAVPVDAPMVSKEEHDNLLALMGRMSTELGELRKQVTPPEEEPEQYYSPPPVSSDQVEQVEQLVEQHGGAEVAAWAAVNAPHLYEAALDSWSEQGGAAARKAAEFNINYQMEYARIEAETAASESRTFHSSLEQALNQDVVALAPEYGLVAGDEQTDALLALVLEEAPGSIQRLVVSRDEGERKEGLRTLLVLAQARAAAAGGLPSVAESTGALAAAQAAAKGAASVGSGSLRPADAPPPPVAGSEAALFADITKAILNAPSTSIAAGLSYGN